MWVKAKLLISLLGLLYIQAKRNFVQQISELESAEWDGPVLHEVFYRNIIELPCAASNRVQQKVNQLLRNSKRHQFHIRWVHNRWDNVVDPWGGDGRRVYMEYNLESIPQHMLQEDYTISSVVTGGMLSIAEVKPTDNGVYACLVTFSDQNWRHVNLDASIVISAHILRVKYPHVEGKMGHILDPMYAWTWNFYHEADAASREFSYECDSEILLTLISRSDINSELWSIGWYHVPPHGPKGYWKSAQRDLDEDDYRYGKSSIWLAPEESHTADLPTLRKGRRLCIRQLDCPTLEQLSEESAWMRETFNTKAAKKQRNWLIEEDEANIEARITQSGEKARANLAYARLHAANKWNSHLLLSDQVGISRDINRDVYKLNDARKKTSNETKWPEDVTGIWQCWVEGYSSGQLAIDSYKADEQLAIYPRIRRTRWLVTEIRINAGYEKPEAEYFDTDTTVLVIILICVPSLLLQTSLLICLPIIASEKWAHLLPIRAPTYSKKLDCFIGDTNRPDSLDEHNVLRLRLAEKGFYELAETTDISYSSENSRSTITTTNSK